MTPPPLSVIMLAFMAVSGSTASGQPTVDDSIAVAGSDGPDAGEADAASLEEAAELLDNMREHPVDVNRATADELASVPGIDAVAAEAILEWRARNGPLVRLEQLLEVRRIDERVLAQARPYLTVSPSIAGPQSGWLRASRFTITQSVRRRIDVPAGYRGTDSTRTYPGSPARLHTRIHARVGERVSIGISLEKDPGERLDAPVTRFDHGVMSASVERMGPLRSLVVGDFVADFGQGLVLGRAAGVGKGTDATRAPMRSGRGLRSYSSSSEYGFLRGVGATVAPTRFLSLTAFASRRLLDATIVDSGAGGPVATSLTADGLHRTPAEVSRRGTLGESLAGGSVEAAASVRGNQARIGILGYSARFDMPVEPPERPDTRQALRGRSHAGASVFGSARGAGVHAFGEVGRGLSGPTAFVIGAGGSAGPTTEVLLHVRNYPPGFVAPRGSPFGERGGAGQNERGAYVAIETRPSRAWMINGYVDLYRFPWLRFNVPRPSRGQEAMIAAEMRPRRWLRLYAHARAEMTDDAVETANVDGGSSVGSLQSRSRSGWRVQADLQASRALRLRARFEVVRSRRDGRMSYGSLMFQDVRWLPRTGLRLDGRIVMFQTDDFESRLFQLESDVAGSFTMPALHGTGVRAYAVVSTSPMSNLTVQAKLGATYLQDTTRQGAGPDQVDGHRAAEASLLARWRISPTPEN